MSSAEDSELERLKARRLAEMQENIRSRRAADPPGGREGEGEGDGAPCPADASPRDLLVGRLGFRGLEVLENAESQFPYETRIIVKRLSELVRSGEIGVAIDGGQLLALFRSVGLYVKMATKINVEQDGKFVSLGDRLRSRSPDGDDGGDPGG